MGEFLRVALIYKNITLSFEECFPSSLQHFSVEEKTACLFFKVE